VRAEARTMWQRDGLEAEFKWMLSNRDSEREKGEKLEADMAIETASREAAEERATAAEARRAEAEARAVAAEALLAEIRGSRSWRALEPLRRVRALLRGLRG
jgi:hypothetical protein